MTWRGPPFREDHRPGDIGGPPVQFAVDEVADASQSQTDRRDGAAEIRNFPEIPAFPARNPYRSEDHPDKPAVERHAALPDREYGEWFANVAAEVVKQDVSEAASDHDAQNQVEQQIVQVIRRHVQLPVLRVTAQH